MMLQPLGSSQLSKQSNILKNKNLESIETSEFIAAEGSPQLTRSNDELQLLIEKSGKFQETLKNCVEKEEILQSVK